MAVSGYAVLGEDWYPLGYPGLLPIVMLPEKVSTQSEVVLA